jgi:hypothetical protein
MFKKEDKRPFDLSLKSVLEVRATNPAQSLKYLHFQKSANMYIHLLEKGNWSLVLAILGDLNSVQ